MTVQEVAIQLGIKPATIRHQIKQGKLAATRELTGHLAQWHITPEEVDRYSKESLGRFPGTKETTK